MTARPPASPDQATRHRRRKARRTRLLVSAGVLIALYTLIGFFGVPLLVTRVLVPRVSEGINGSVRIAEMDFNPFLFSVELRDAHVLDDAGTPIAGFARFEGNFSAFASIFADGWRFSQARVVEPYASVEIDESGVLNLLRLRSKQDAAGVDAQPLQRIPRIVVADLNVTDASVMFRDTTTEPPVENAVDDLSFVIDLLDTRPDHANTHTLDARIGDDASIAWTGTSYVDPLTTEGTIRIEGLDLATFAPYLRRAADVSLNAGELSLSLSYRLAPARSSERLTVRVETVRLNGLDVDSEAGPLAGVGLIEVSGIEGSLEDRRIEVERLAIRSLSAYARRFDDGRIELLRILPQRSASASAGDRAERERVEVESIEFPVQRLLTGVRYLAEDLASDWAISLGSVEIDESALEMTDAATPRPFALSLRDVRLRAGPMASETLFATGLTIEATVSEGGRVRLDGSMVPAEGRVELAVAAEDIDGVLAAPYLPPDLPAPVTGADLTRLRLDLDGRFTGAVSDSRYDLAWSGEVMLRDTQLTDSNGDPMLAAEILTVKGDLAATMLASPSSMSIDWDGAIAVRVASGDLTMPDSSVFAGSLGEAGAEGKLGLQLGSDATRVRWSGGLEARDLAGSMGELGPADSAQAGRLAVSGDLSLERSAGKVTADWTGDAEISDGSASLEGEAPMDMSALALRIQQGAVKVAPGDFSLHAGLVEVTGPQSKGVLSSVGAEANASAEPGGLAGIKLPIHVAVDRLLVTDGRFALEDRSVQPPVLLEGRALHLEATDIDSTGSKATSLDLRFDVADAGQTAITGRLNPFVPVPELDLEIRVSDLPLPPLSPRAEPNLGYRIDQGRLTLDMPVQVRDGQLDGAIDATLRSFFLGERTPSDSAPDLPIKFGLSLLRDPDDSISAKIGLSGDVTDPNFSFSSVVWKAIFGLVRNVATAPFKLIGELAGVGSERDLSSVAFVPGEARLAPGEIEALDAIATALGRRPNLHIIVFGLTGPDDDAALRRAHLESLIRERTRADEGEREALLAILEQVRSSAKPFGVPVPPGRLSPERLDDDDIRAILLRELELPPEAMADLRARRAQAIVGELTGSQGISADRVQLGTGSPAAGGSAAVKGPLAVFELTGG